MNSPTTGQPEQNKALIERLSGALYNYTPESAQLILGELLHTDAAVHLCHPLGSMNGPDALYETAYRPLHEAIPDLERREYIRMAGPSETAHQWVGCAGFYTGVFSRPWLGIPATGHVLTMRFHEFFRIENGKVVEIQAIWDICDVMLQAGVWPMARSLGHELHIPGPALNDGIRKNAYDASESQQTRQHVIDMLNHMQRHPLQGGPEIMRMDQYWHPKMMWYGPSGIGTSRGIEGFRRRHQIPFLNAMPDRGQNNEGVSAHFFADGPFAAVTGWPSMSQHLSCDGWLGIAPSGQKLAIRSLDFWRLEDGLIRENWVLLDLLDIYRQLDVNVLARMQELA